MIQQCPTYGHYDKKLDTVLDDVSRRISAIWKPEESLSLRLSEYSGRADVLFSFPEAMARFNPKDPNNLRASDFEGKEALFEQICLDYHIPMEIVREQKFRQAQDRAIQILTFLFMDRERIQLLLQGPQCHFPTGIRVIRSCLKGPKRCSAIHPAPQLYMFEGEPLFPDAVRILFEHSKSDFLLKPFVKNMIYGKLGLNESDSDQLTFYIVSTDEPPIIAHIYDDRGITINAPPQVLYDLKEKFSDWVRDLEEEF